MSDTSENPRRARASIVGAIAALVLLAACGQDSEEGGGPATDHRMAGAVTVSPDARPDDRLFEELQSFVDGYWVRPIPPQGSPPASWATVERSLRPEDCSTCHPDQYDDWRTAVHSEAYSPGLSGQLVNWEDASFGTVQSCLVCHAPLSEQSARLRAGEEWISNAEYDDDLRNHGIVCAACHIRGNRRYGPPRNDGSLAPSAEGSPHGGVTRTPFFEDSRFCAACHQFGPGGAAPNGKPLENTFAEWESSRYAEEGVSCQHCHMPDRRHLWRGIHDPEMVRSGVTIEWTVDADREVAGVRITNTGTGHRFPTYATPEVVVNVELLDSESRPLTGSSTEYVIARRIEYQNGSWVEVSDTRLAPDSFVVVSVPSAGGAAHVRARIVVRPDAFYRGVFEALLAGTLSDTSRSLLEQARRNAEDSRFTLFEDTVPLRR